MGEVGPLLFRRPTANDVFENGKGAEALRFTDDDLSFIGTLAVGQFGVVASLFHPFA